MSAFMSNWRHWLMQNEWVKYFNLAKKAGAVVYGIDEISKCRRKVYLIVLSEKQATQNLIEKVNNYIAKKNTKLIKLNDDLNAFLNTNNCKVIGLTNENLANQIKTYFKE